MRADGSETPVCVHVRRGDYLTCDNPEYFSGIATDAYYAAAIDYMRSHVGRPRFYFFSDDAAWCADHFDIDGKVVVDWNKGQDAILDMYLMSHFPAMIIANSTFSFWAAQNNALRPLVVCPPRFNNLAYDTSMRMPSWVAIDGRGTLLTTTDVA